MSDSPTLGLDAFCHKFLLWQDSSGKTHLSFNDLLLIAERQDANKSIALRVINYRLNTLLEAAENKKVRVSVCHLEFVGKIAHYTRCLRFNSQT